MLDTNILSFMFGILIKSYDDIFDNIEFRKLFSEWHIELIKTFTISIYTIISIKNLNFPFIILIVHILFYIIDKESLNSSFYIAGLLLTLFLCIYEFSSSSLNIGQIIITTLLIIFGGWLDHKLFPEECSTRKIIARFIETIIVALLYIFFKDYFVKEAILFAIGYGTTSVLNMSILEFNKMDTPISTTANDKESTNI